MSDSQFKKIEYWLKVLTVFMGTLLVGLGCLVLKALQSILLPFCIALFIVYLVEPLQKLLVRLHLPVGLRVSMVLVFTGLVLFDVGQLVYSSASALGDNIPRYEQRVLGLMDQVIQSLAIPAEEVKSFTSNFKWSDHVKPGTVATMLGQGFGTFLEFMTNLFMILLYMVYLLFERESFFRRIDKSFSKERSERIVSILSKINRQIGNYLNIKTGLSVLTGAIVTIVLLIFRVDFALFWGILTFLLNFIPSVGSIIATIPPVLVAFLQFDTFGIPVAVLVTLLVIQGVIGNVIEPKMMGTSLGLSPLIVIGSLIFWGWLWGPVGMILSVPIVSACLIIFENIEILKPVSKLLSEQS
ncbi:AI-2E family transporter [Deltaproteobacteria bacterium TL4]